MNDASQPEQQPAYTDMTADVYDAIYARKDYAQEAAVIKKIIARFKLSAGHQLLDVACGTGNHLVHLADEFTITGLDKAESQLLVARKKLPKLKFLQGDMLTFRLGQTYDIVTCLFSSVAYASKLADMRQAVSNMANHLLPGGLLILEAWFTKQQYKSKTVHAVFVDKPELKISRIHKADIENGKSVMDMHCLIGQPSGVEYFVERHELGLYTETEYTQAIADAGLRIEHQTTLGHNPNPLFVGIKPF